VIRRQPSLEIRMPTTVALPTVSVFVPSYNYGHFLPECVSSVLDQDGVEARVLILDDASTDDTPEVAAKLAVDPRLEYVRHVRNRGHIRTYNEGIDWADGDFVVLLSADDLLTPGSLRRAAEIMTADPDVAFVYGRAVPFVSGQPLPRPRIRIRGGRSHVWPGDRWIDAICRRGRNVIAAPEVVVRTSAQKHAGGYRTELPRTGDLEMWLRLASLGSVGRVLDSDQAYYRQHESNMHNTRLTTAIEYTAQRKAAFDSFFAINEAVDPAQATARRAVAYRSLSRRTLASVVHALDRGQDRLDGNSPVEIVRFCAAMCDVRTLPEFRALAWRLSLSQRTRHLVGPLVAAATLRHPRAWARAKAAPLLALPSL
jgi:hypothetical protein